MLRNEMRPFFICISILLVSCGSMSLGGEAVDIFYVNEDLLLAPTNKTLKVSGNVLLYGNEWAIYPEQYEAGDSCLTLAFKKGDLPKTFPGEFSGEISGKLQRHSFSLNLDAVKYVSEKHDAYVSNSPCLDRIPSFLIVERYRKL